MHADGPPIRVLATSGAIVSDLPIATFERPSTLPGGRVVFRGVSTETLSNRDGTDRPYLRTGDPLPAPLDGTVNEIIDVSFNADTVAVAADVNSTAATNVVLIDNGTGLVPFVTNTDDAQLAGVVLNTAGDLLYWASPTLLIRQAGAGASQTIGTIGEQPPLRPILGDGPTAVWIAGREGPLSYWTPASGALTIATGRFRRTNRLRLGLALDVRFGVAFIRPISEASSVSGAFLWSNSTRTTTTLARLNDPVGDRTISRFHGPIEFLDDGSVAFEVDLRGRRPSLQRHKWVLAHDGTLAVTTSLGRARSHMPVERRGALFAVDGTTVSPLIRPGDPIAGGGTVASVEAHAAGEDGVVAIVTTDEGGEILVRRDGRQLVPLETGDIYFDDGLLYGSRRTVLASGDVTVATRRRLVPLAPPSEDTYGDFFATSVAVGGDRVFALATFGECEGIFAARRRKLFSVVTAGSTAACGARSRLASIDGIAASPRQLVALGSKGDGRNHLYRVRGRRLQRIPSSTLEPVAVLLAGERVVFVAGSPDDPTRQQLFRAATPAPIPLLREGDPSAAGTMRFEPSDVFAGAGNQVLVTATVRGGGVRHALVAQSVSR